MFQLMEKLLMCLVIIIYCNGIVGSEFINLKYFRTVMPFDEDTITSTCLYGCEKLDVSDSTNPLSRFTSETCYGSLYDCRTIIGRNNGTVQFCSYDDHGVQRLSWIENKQYLGKPYGTKPNECIPTRLDLKKTTEGNCEVCMCTCVSNPSLEKENLYKFSLVEQTSDDDKFSFFVHCNNWMINNIVYLQIKENEFPPRGNGTWKPIKVDPKSELDDENKYATLSQDLMTIKLVQVFATANSVITGVKFEKVQNPDKLTSALELKIRSTKLNEETTGLDHDHQDWNSGETSTLTSGSKWWPDRGIRNLPMPTVSFNRSDLHEDFGKTTSPQIFANAIESCWKQEYPLSGVQLLLVSLEDKEVIVPRISPAFINGSQFVDQGDDEFEEEAENLPDSANTSNLHCIFMVMVTLLIISNLFN